MGKKIKHYLLATTLPAMLALPEKWGPALS